MKELAVSTHKQSLNNVLVGKGVKIYDFVNAYQCQIDDGSKIELS
jgi:hypothetical protein